MSEPVTVLQPSRWHAAAYALAGIALIVVTSWIVGDSGGHALAILLLVASVVATVPFVAQLVVPAAFAWRLDEHGLEARPAGRRVWVAWGDVHFAQVVDSAGDPALRLDLGGGGSGTSRTLRLPVGADLAALHRALARHLGPVGIEASPDGTGGEGGEGARSGPDDGADGQ